MNTGHTPGYLINKINEALCSAFPDKHKLEMMVLYELNIKLNEIASVGNLKVIVHNLIIHCQASNELENLIDGALKQNPNNVKLKAINKEFEITTSLVKILGPLESNFLKEMQQAYRVSCHYEFRDDTKYELPGSFYDILKKLDNISQATDDETLIVKFVDHLLLILLVDKKFPNSKADKLKQWLETNTNKFSKLLVYKSPISLNNKYPKLEKSRPQPDKEGLKQFSFEVITVDRRGVRIKQESQQASYFTQDLGNGVDLEMVSIPAGSFLMGSSKSERGSDDRERPVHKVTIQPFFLGKYQVTQAQWRAVVKNLPKVNRDLDPDPSKIKGENRPVEGVNWYDAVEFCDRLSEYTGTKYRLPSEAEWEYACRAGTTTPFHYGETITSRFANYNASHTYAQEARGYSRGETTPVGSFPPNSFGLYDMHGNVLEWCGDPDHGNYKGAPTDGRIWSINWSIWNINHIHLNYYILRGGSCNFVPSNCRSAYRSNGFGPFCIGDLIGFRVAQSVGKI